MKRKVMLVALALAASVSEAGIYKCKYANAVTYMDRPCPDGSEHADISSRPVSWVGGSGQLQRAPAIRALLQKGEQRSRRERKSAGELRREIIRATERKQARCSAAEQKRRNRWNAPRSQRRKLQREEFAACR